MYQLSVISKRKMEKKTKPKMERKEVKKDITQNKAHGKKMRCCGKTGLVAR
jgi:hypothetical protein